MKTCKVEGCENTVCKKGYCSKHYQQMRRCGKILTMTKFDKNVIYEENGIYRMKLYNNKSEVISETIFNNFHLEKIRKYKWCLGTGYARTKIDGKYHQLSNFSMGDFKQEFMYDHKDRDRLNNLSSNLRKVTRSQNGINKSIQSNNTSGVTGVHFTKRENKFIVQIQINKKNIWLGQFTNIEDAISARLKAEIKYHKEYSPNHNK